MSKGLLQPQDDSSSEWLKNKVDELRRLFRETEFWPETGDQLISDLSQFTTSPTTTPPNEDDNNMLSIVVNDALIGIDIMKKYPAFYARMLVDAELRTAFLETLELLEEGQAEELPDFPDLDIVNLDFLQKVISSPIIGKSIRDNLELIWQRTVEQLQTMFYINRLKPREVRRSGEFLSDEGTINILHSQVEIDDQELDVRLDLSYLLDNPGNLELMMSVLTPEEITHCFEVTIAWGDYRETAVINKYGLAKFPLLKRELLFGPADELMHGLELRLEQVI